MISDRKTFGIIDTLGHLLAVPVVAANTSDNPSGIDVADTTRERSSRFWRLWCDTGLMKTFLEHCRSHQADVEVVNRIHPSQFVALSKGRIVKGTRS